MVSEIEDKPAVDFGGRFGTVDERIEKRTDVLRRHPIHVPVYIFHHAVIKDRLGRADNEVIVERHIVKEVSHQPVVALPLAHGGAVWMVLGHIGVLGD